MQPDETPHVSEPLRPITLTPPTLAEPLLGPKPQSKWPMPVGVIAIVVASLSILMNACGAVSMVMMSTVYSRMPAANVAATMPAEMLEMPPEVLVSLAVRGVLSIVLLAIGIGIVQRRRWSARAARSWAIVAIVVCLLTAVVEHRAQERNLKIMANTPGMAMPMGQGMFSSLMMLQVYVWLLVRSALPVFLLVWFGRQRIREEVASWQGPSASVGQ